MKHIYDLVPGEELQRRAQTSKAETWFILQGAGTLRHAAEHVPLKTGDMLQLPCDCQYVLEQKNCVVGRMTLFDLNATVQTIRLFPAENNLLLRQFFLLALQLQCQSLPNKERVLSLMDQLIFELMIALSNTLMPGNAKVGMLLDMITSHYLEPDFDLHAAIVATNYNPNYLNKLFRDETGLAPRQFLIQRRIDHSKQLLRTSHGKPSVKAVAQQSGFSDPIYFSRQFRQHEGMSPLEYWRRNGTY